MKTVGMIALVLCFSVSLWGWQAAEQKPTPSSASSSPDTSDSRLGMDGPVRAEDVFKSIETFKGKPATQVLIAMNAIRGNLGVSCTHCHTQFEWEKNDKPAKETTRKMFKMLGYIEGTYFDHKNKVTCWTCHHGHPDQPKPAEQASKEAEKFIHLTPEEEKKPAQEVFKNIQSFKGLPAGRVPFIMDFFAQALGVQCTHCHVKDQWDKDDVEAKKTARKMLGMATDVIHQFYGKGGPIGCYGCHQGKVKPENGMEQSNPRSAVSGQP